MGMFHKAGSGASDPSWLRQGLLMYKVRIEIISTDSIGLSPAWKAWLGP